MPAECLLQLRKCSGGRAHLLRKNPGTLFELSLAIIVRQDIYQMSREIFPVEHVPGTFLEAIRASLVHHDRTTGCQSFHGLDTPVTISYISFTMDICSRVIRAGSSVMDGLKCSGRPNQQVPKSRVDLPPKKVDCFGICHAAANSRGGICPSKPCGRTSL